MIPDMIPDMTDAHLIFDIVVGLLIFELIREWAQKRAKDRAILGRTGR